MQSFTDKFIKSLKPKDKPYIERERAPRGEGGFVIRVFPSGAKTWQIVYTLNGKRKWLSLGSYPLTGLSDARKRFRTAKELLEQGLDPGEKKRGDQRAAREGLTVNDLCDLFLTKYADREKKASSAKEDRLNLARDVRNTIGNYLASEITRSDLQEVLNRIADRGAKVQTQRTRSTIRKMFKWAEEEELIKENPALTIRAPKVHSKKTRTLSPEEISIFWHTIDNNNLLPKAVGIILKIILLTGVRSGEAIKIYKNYCGNNWVLLKSDETKNHDPHRVYLPKLARNLLNDIDNDLTLSSDPNYRIENYTISSWVRNFKYFGLNENWSPHDLRRTCSTKLAELKIEPHIIKKVLNHRDKDITSDIYIMYGYDDEIIHALELLSNKIEEIISTHSPALTIPIAHLRGSIHSPEL